MQAALYDAECGYYTTLTRFDDFLTSPEVHPAFGWLLGRQALEVWEVLERPRPFCILELGGGSGALAETLLEYLRPRVSELVYVIDEPSPALRQTQQGRLRRPEFRWSSEQSAHLVVANEVADALPVHRMVMREGELHELRVTVDASDALTWVEADSVPEQVETYFQQVGVRPREGAVSEVSTGLPQWTHHLADRLDRGVAIILDYGYTAEQLFSRKHGTLLTYWRHMLGGDPLVRLGEQDISAHVDFSCIAMAAHQAGLRVVGVTSQRTLLRHLGIGALIDSARAPLHRARLSDLVDPHGLGRIGALFLARGLTDYAPVGLCGGRDWPSDDTGPTLDDDSAFGDLWREAFVEQAARVSDGER